MRSNHLSNLAGRLALAVVLSSAAAIAAAAPIVYTFSGTASGTVGMTDFIDAQVTATAQGDTDAIVASTGFFCNNLGTVYITIGGVGNFTTEYAQLVFSNQSNAIWGFENGTCALPSNDWLDVYNADAASYALATAIGPSTGTTDLRQAVELKGGIFLQFRTSPQTFQARLGSLPPPSAAPVPAPVPTLGAAMLAILALLLAGTAAFGARRVRA